MPPPSLLDIAHLPCADLPELIHIPPLTRPFNVTITPPGSKSLTNRALLLAALADGSDGTESTLHNALIDADDTRVMITALRQLGAEITIASAAPPPSSPAGRGASARRGGEGSSSTSPPQPPTSQSPDAPPTLHIRGTSGRWHVPPQGLTLHLENAGTAVRFLTAAAILAAPGAGPIIIDGSPRMRERPIGELVTALRQLKARIEYLGTGDRLPIRILPPRARFLFPKREVIFGRVPSSQFASAIALIAPFRDGGIVIRFREDAGPLPSASYFHMTLRLLDRVGARVESPHSSHGSPRRHVHGTNNALHIFGDRPSGLPAFEYRVEPDASSASYFLGAAAISPGSSVCIPDLDAWSSLVAGRQAALRNAILELQSMAVEHGKEISVDQVALDDLTMPYEQSPLQPDVAFAKLLGEIGCEVSAPQSDVNLIGPLSLGPLTADFSNAPDLAMTAATLACFASPTPTNPTATSTLRGLRTLRHKESDRLAALQTELTKLGAQVEIETTPTDEILRIIPPSPLRGAGSHLDTSPPRHLVFETYNDHRMAMALALVGLRRPNVCIKDPACVAKTYPTFWQHLARLYSA